MHTDFQIQARELNVSSAAKTFSVLAYTGGKLQLRNFESPVVIDLARLKLGKSLVANLDHDSSQRVGIVTEVQNNGRELRLLGTLSAATKYRDEVLASYKDGFRWQASIEASFDDGKELSRGKSQQVNGQNIVGPAIIAVGTLKGFAFVSHGADDSTEVSIAASRPYRPVPYNPNNFSGLTSGLSRWIQ